MAVTVKRIALWRSEVENKPGILAAVLGPLASNQADLQILMGYRFPGNEMRAAIELYPISGKKNITAAKAAGLNATSIPTLLVQGDNRAGLGYAVARALADAGINMGFVVTQVIGRKYSAIFGFGSEADAKVATALIKKAVAPEEGQVGRS